MMTDKDFWMRMRAHLIEEEKALTQQRAAVIGQRKAIERFLDMPSDPAPIHETELDTIAVRIPYSA